MGDGLAGNVDGCGEDVGGVGEDVGAGGGGALIVDEPLGPGEWGIVADGLRGPGAVGHGCAGSEMYSSNNSGWESEAAVEDVAGPDAGGGVKASLKPGSR